MSESTTSVEIVKCEKHGLRYNAAIQSGCVRCRKEVGTRPSSNRVPGNRSGMTARPGGSSSSAVPTLLLTAGLLLGTSFGLFMMHSNATAAFQDALVLGGPSLFEESDDDNYDSDPYGSAGEPFDFCDKVNDPDAMLTREERRQYTEMCNDPIFRDP